MRLYKRLATSKHRKYNRNGQLLNEFEYVNGEITHSVVWFDSSFQARRLQALFETFNKSDSVGPAVIQVQSEGWYDPVRKSRHSIVYKRTGQVEKRILMMRR